MTSIQNTPEIQALLARPDLTEHDRASIHGMALSPFYTVGDILRLYPAPPSSEPVQTPGKGKRCAATTKAGKRCRLHTSPGKTTCCTHADWKPTPIRQLTPEEEDAAYKEMEEDAEPWVTFGRRYYDTLREFYNICSAGLSQEYLLFKRLGSDAKYTAYCEANKRGFRNSVKYYARYGQWRDLL